MIDVSDDSETIDRLIDLDPDLNPFSGLRDHFNE